MPLVFPPGVFDTPHPKGVSTPEVFLCGGRVLLGVWWCDAPSVMTSITRRAIELLRISGDGGLREVKWCAFA